MLNPLTHYKAFRAAGFMAPAALKCTNRRAVEEITRRTEETVLPVVREMGGDKGVLSLHSGKALSITLWEDKEAMVASEEAAHQTRAQAADIASELIGGVERFEVTFWEIS